LQDIKSNTFDSIITDPPYGIVNKFGINKNSKGTRTLEFEWDDEDTSQMVSDALSLSLNLCKPTASIFVFTSIDIIGQLIPVVRDHGFTVKPAAWIKKCPPPAGKGNWWPSGFELAFYGYRGNPWFGDKNRKRSNVFTYDSMRFGQPGKNGHPTQKPIALMRKIVRSICPSDGLVLDPFAGSGSTLEACALEGRRFVGIEINKKYVDLIWRRLRRFQ